MKYTRFVLILALGLGSASLFSCKKCLKCSFDEPSNLTNVREDCGNKDYLELFKADVIKEAEGFGVEEAKVTCVDSK